MSENNDNRPPAALMNKKQYLTTLGLIAVFGLVWFVYTRKPDIIGEKFAEEVAEAHYKHAYRTYPIMGTFAEVSLYGPKDIVDKAADAATDEMRKVEKVCNIFQSESELSKLNKTAYEKPFKCGKMLWDILKISRKAYEVSDGAFDITAKPLMDLWGFYRKRGDSLPLKIEIDIAKSKTGLYKVNFNDLEHSVKFNHKGMSFDLGGIAKGYAVDLAVKAAKKFGIKVGIINLAGNMYCFPEPKPGKEFYRICIRNPIDKTQECGYVDCKDISMATSGNYERYVTIGGVRYTHIMNIKTGMPVKDMLSVTVLTPKAVDADFLSTSIFINGVDFAKKICKEYKNTQVLIIK